MILYCDRADRFINEIKSLSRKYKKALLQYKLKNMILSWLIYVWRSLVLMADLNHFINNFANNPG